jgi:RNA polymerase sigma factor (sigma-70 family)
LYTEFRVGAIKVDRLNDLGEPRHHRSEFLAKDHRSPLVGYFRRYLPEEDAKDLAQEVLISAFLQMDPVDDSATRSWLYRTANRRLIDHLRRVRHNAQRLAPIPERDEREYGQKEPGFELAEVQDWISQTMGIAFEVCSPNQSTVMRSFYSCGSFDVVAAELGLEPATVRSHFLRGRATLLAHLLQHRPDLLGGREAIFSAIDELERDIKDGFSKAERVAIAEPERQPKAFRSACLKIARHLSAPR